MTDRDAANGLRTLRTSHRSGPCRRGILVLLAALALLGAACSADQDYNTPPASRPGAPGTPAASALREVSGPLVVAVGDIACAPGSESTPTTCQQDATAKLARSYQPRLVLTLGDQQYESGELSAYQSSYATDWGALKPITHPVPGNHEYKTEGASGYYAYFREQQPGDPGYYAFDVGTWRIYALNSNCDDIDCEREDRWLDQDMSRNPRRCSALTMHHPRYSSAEHGPSTVVQPFWQTARRHRADLALAGNDHDYERFRRMNASGEPTATGIASFVSGAGGKTLYDFSSPLPGSVARHNRTFGVLALRLGRGRYAWEYRTIAGTVLDAGVGRCV